VDAVVIEAAVAVVDMKLAVELVVAMEDKPADMSPLSDSQKTPDSQKTQLMVIMMSSRREAAVGEVVMVYDLAAVDASRDGATRCGCISHWDELWNTWNTLWHI
jgi:hypothetical protein